MAVISSSLCIPSQSVFVPGSPSPLRPKKPPKLATIRTASLKLGGFDGAIGLLVLYATNAFHSASSKNPVHGTSGTALQSLVKQHIRLATTIAIARHAS